jgi:dTMP kinase
MVGRLIVIDGTDGSGKRTQSERLVEVLRERGYNAVRVEFPRYGERSAAMVEDYLNGKFGGVEQVNAYQASIFYACDRYAASFHIRDLLANDTIVICDRYASANMGHQTGKIKDPVERDKFLEWLNHLEFGIFEIPSPDVNILLYMPPEVGQALVDQKSLRAYIKEGKRDIHENDLNHLSHAAQAFLYCAKKYSWHVIDCAKDNKPRPVPEIGEDVLHIVLPKLDTKSKLKL